MVPHRDAESTRRRGDGPPITEDDAMPRDLPIGNGSLLVNFDGRYALRDLYFPHVGQENQTGGDPNRFGCWVDGEFAWLDGDGW